MKRYYILVFTLIGLCFMEWSCFRCDDDPYDVKAIGLIAELQNLDSLNTYNQVLEAYDSIEFQTVAVNLVLDMERLASAKYASSSSVYATDCDGPYPQLISSLDSLKVFSREQDEWTESTHFFSYRVGDRYRNDTVFLATNPDIKNLFGGGYHFLPATFFYNQDPVLRGQIEYQFRLYYDGKDSLVTTTEPIIITP